MEFALLVPAVLLIVVMVVETAVVARAHIQVMAAAREGVRAAATVPDPAVALAAANDALGALAPKARINVHRPHVVGATARVTIKLDYQLRLVLIPGPTVPLSATAAMRVER